MRGRYGDGRIKQPHDKHISNQKRNCNASRWQRFEHSVLALLEHIGRAEEQRQSVERAQSEAMVRIAHDYVWQPYHNFMLRHKLTADFVGVVFDAVGVIAGGFLMVAAAPELLGGAVVIGTVGILTGGLAAGGSGILLLLDGQLFAAEFTGNEARAEELESSHTRQWFRIVATLMLLPDLPIGGVRALTELSRLGREAGTAGEAAHLLRARAIAQRERAGVVRNPAKHPGPVNKHLARANRATDAALIEHAAVARATHQMRVLAARDINANFVATPGSVGLLAGLPPSLVESSEDIKRDHSLMQSLAPEHGIPKDVRLEMRITGTAPIAGRH